MHTLAVALFASTLVAAGCHRSALNGAPPDLGGVGAGDGADLGDADLGGRDMAGGGAPDLSGAPDMTPPPLIPSDIKYYYGTTSDGWSVVVPGYYAAGPAWALRLADGTARLIVDSQFDAWTDGDLVFVEYDVVTGGYGKLAVWRQGGPAVVLANDMLAIGPRPLSDGAGHVAYYLPWSPNGGLLCFDTVDHAGSRCLAAPFADVAQNGTCTPKARLFGSRLLVQHCPWPVLNPPTKGVLSSYDLAGTADVDLATDALFFDSAPNVGVLVTSRSNALNLVAADGSGTLTTTPLVTDAKSAIFTPDGSAALVVTVANALERVDLASHAVTVLQTSSVGVAHVSNDGSFATYRASTDPMTGLGDLWLSDVRNAGTTAVALVPTTTAYFALGNGFTSDSAFVVYLADATTNEDVGSLRARSVAGGSERAIGTGCFPATPVGGSRIMFAENADTSGVPAIADLSFVDLASGAAPTKIATKAYAWYQVMSDGTLVYLQPGEGLHAVKLP